MFGLVDWAQPVTKHGCAMARSAARLGLAAYPAQDQCEALERNLCPNLGRDTAGELLGTDRICGALRPGDYVSRLAAWTFHRNLFFRRLRRFRGVRDQFERLHAIHTLEVSLHHCPLDGRADRPHPNVSHAEAPSRYCVPPNKKKRCPHLTHWSGSFPSGGIGRSPRGTDRSSCRQMMQGRFSLIGFRSPLQERATTFPPAQACPRYSRGSYSSKGDF